MMQHCRVTWQAVALAERGGWKYDPVETWSSMERVAVMTMVIAMAVKMVMEEWSDCEEEVVVQGKVVRRESKEHVV